MRSSADVLDPAALGMMQRTFLARMPDFGDFTEREGSYWQKERAYKEELAGLCRASLPRELFADGRGANTSDVLQGAKRVLTSRLESAGIPQNLLSWRYYEVVKTPSEREQELLAAGLGDLLYGTGSSPERVERFTRALWPLFQRTSGGHNPYAQARMFPTFFLMLLYPTTDIAVRTDMFDGASRSLLGRRVLRDAPFSAAEYEDVLTLSHGVRAQLEKWAWCPRDLIDVHSFLWIATRDTYSDDGEVD